MKTVSENEHVRSLVAPYQSPHHTVVTFRVENDAPYIVGSGEQPSGNSYDDLIFEIGSITKVFTAILLCLQVEEGKVDPDAPLAEMSERLSCVPEWITPARLVSHTSGLPNLYVPLWKALFMSAPEGPYAQFTQNDLLGWFQNRRGQDPGDAVHYGYSNLGFGLLGEAIAIREATPFADLLLDKVIHPLGLTDTIGFLSANQQQRFVQPKDVRGNAVSPWRFQALAGAGCLRSSARDMACFSASVMRALTSNDTPLDRAIGRSVEPVFGLGPRRSREQTSQCSGWLSTKFKGADPRFLFANGGTAGSTSSIFICPETSQALGVLSNNGIAGHLWGSMKLGWSNPLRTAHQYFAAALP